MANNGYSSYNYQGYSQGSAQHYGGYAAPPTNAATQNARQQYQHPATATTQATDYLSTSSYAAPTYSTQNTGTYGRSQDTAWTGSSSYGANRETTRGAAEVLRNMSNTSSYGSNATAANAASTAPARYTSSPAQHQSLAQPQQQSHTSHSHAQVQAPQQTQLQNQLQNQHAHSQTQLHAPQTQSQPQSQARPRSVNTARNQPAAPNRGVTSPAMAAGYPPQRTQSAYSQQPQRAASPVQVQYSTNPPVSTAQTAPRATATPTQYAEYRQRQLPNVDASRNTPATAVPAASSSYSYSDAQVTAPAAVAQPAASTTVLDQYNQGSITVDPMAVYNPYTEWEKKRAARAEEERKAEEVRLEGERRKEEERKKAEEERAQQAAQPQTQDLGPNDDAGAASNPLESEIRAVMAKMRELNSKDPTLLARIWEEERQAKAPKSPTTQNKATPQSANAQPAGAPPAPSMVQKAPAQRKKAPPQQLPQTQPVRPPSIPIPPIPSQAPTPRPQAPIGNNIWPEDKQAQAAHTIAENVLALNPGRQLTSETVIAMLAGNPSYIGLCEQLEAMSLKLDRAALAKALLAAVPDLNSAARSQAQTQPRNPAQPSQRFAASPAVPTKRESIASAFQSPHYAPAHHMMNGSSYPPFPDGNKEGSNSPAPVAQMIPIKAVLKPPANKEEAARKRTFEDLIDLTAISDEDMEPLPKKQNVVTTYYSPYGSPGPTYDNRTAAPKNNFPIPNIPSHVHPQPKAHAPLPTPPINLRGQTIVQPLDRKKALRRNGYNIATIARDVLLACGRHPEERQLNGHLEVLQGTLPQVSHTSDLSTLRWYIIDPGEPPKGYYRDSSQTLAEDADDEEDSDEEEGRERERRARAKSSAQAVGGALSSPAGQDLPPPVNPFKPAKKRGPGRPPRHSYPIGATTSAATATPRQQKSTNTNMSATAPRTAAGSVGYSAFRAGTEYGPDGKPLPKKRGRPVGWRKSIHGSPAAQAKPSSNGHTGANRNYTPTQPSSLRNVRSGDQDIMIRSSSRATSKSPRQQSFKCKWQNCKADLHNLETLKKHVQKVHRKETLRGTLECLWGDCGRQVSSVHPTTGVMAEKHTPFSFNEEAQWREHLEVRHFSPLAWELGDGPASGHSDAHDSDHYLSDAQGRRVTPRVSVDPSRFTGSPAGRGVSAGSGAMQSPRPRGRPPKSTKEREAREAQELLVAQKKRMGGPGIDRGGATLVNDKRRKGFSDDDQTEEEFVDADT